MINGHSNAELNAVISGPVGSEVVTRQARFTPPQMEYPWTFRIRFNSAEAARPPFPNAKLVAVVDGVVVDDIHPDPEDPLIMVLVVVRPTSTPIPKVEFVWASRVASWLP